MKKCICLFLFLILLLSLISCRSESPEYYVYGLMPPHRIDYYTQVQYWAEVEGVYRHYKDETQPQTKSFSYKDLVIEDAKYNYSIKGVDGKRAHYYSVYQYGSFALYDDGSVAMIKPYSSYSYYEGGIEEMEELNLESLDIYGMAKDIIYELSGVDASSYYYDYSAKKYDDSSHEVYLTKYVGGYRTDEYFRLEFYRDGHLKRYEAHNIGLFSEDDVVTINTELMDEAINKYLQACFASAAEDNVEIVWLLQDYTGIDNDERLKKTVNGTIYWEVRRYIYYPSPYPDDSIKYKCLECPVAVFFEPAPEDGVGYNRSSADMPC
ncbi:MAG: hypothetical protein E7666_04230 [Ruminococcaceae bacterium]|nr:hypothetical protein [Oscillospiraceae bacterium]